MTASAIRSHAYLRPSPIDRRNGRDAAAINGMANHSAARPRNERTDGAKPSSEERQIIMPMPKPRTPAAPHVASKTARASRTAVRASPGGMGMPPVS